MDEMKAQFTNIYVKNVDAGSFPSTTRTVFELPTDLFSHSLPSEVTQDEFTALFEKFGSVTSAVLQFDEETKVSKGFGFVNFDNHEDARKAVDELNDSELKGKKLFVARAQKKSEREDELRKSYEASRQEKMTKFAGVNLYVKNIDDEWDDDRLRSEFESFGSITSAKVMRDEGARSRVSFRRVFLVSSSSLELTPFFRSFRSLSRASDSSASPPPRRPQRPSPR